MVYGAIVTGAAGFIGSHLVDFLLNHKEVVRVIAIDNFCPYVGMSQDETLRVKLSNLKKARSSSKFQLLPRDILDVDLALVASQMKAYTGLVEGELQILVFHLAASGGVRPSIQAAKGVRDQQCSSHNPPVRKAPLMPNVHAFVLASRRPCMETAHCA
jgi:dTDP-D-glucose 4,6-dehydratase